jgi:hypothetical protein
VQSVPSSHHELKAWQTGGVHVRSLSRRRPNSAIGQLEAVIVAAGTSREQPFAPACPSIGDGRCAATRSSSSSGVRSCGPLPPRRAAGPEPGLCARRHCSTTRPFFSLGALPLLPPGNSRHVDCSRLR